MGYALQVTAMNQPFGFPDDFNGNLTINPYNLTLKGIILNKTSKYT